MTPTDLVTRHSAWARTQARYYSSPSMVDGTLWITLKDLESAALVGLWRAALRFDGSCLFRSYAKHRVKGAVQDELRKLLSKRWPEDRQRVAAQVDGHRQLTQLVYEGQIEEYLPHPALDPEQQLIDKESARNGLRSLSDRELEAVEGKCRGLTLREIGAGWGVSEARACQVLAAAREKLREAA